MQDADTDILDYEAAPADIRCRRPSESDGSFIAAQEASTENTGQILRDGRDGRVPG